jgi:hypothetical protein
MEMSRTQEFKLIDDDHPRELLKENSNMNPENPISKREIEKLKRLLGETT